MSDDKHEIIPANGDADVQQVLLAAGQAQALGFIEKVARRASLRTLQKIKDSKKYKALSVFEDGKVARCATWADFCEHFVGRSRRAVDEDLQNFEALGEPLVEAGKRIGIGRDDFRVLRQIPQEQLVEIEERVVNTEDKDEVRALIEDIVTAHNDTRAKLEKAEKRASELATDRDDQKLKLKEAREKLQQQDARTWPEFTAAVRMESSQLTEGALLHIDDLERYIDRLLDPGLDPEHPERFSHYNTALMTWWLNVRALQARVNNIVTRGFGEFGAEIDESPENVPVLGEDEARRLLGRRDEMMFLFKQEQEGRARGRAAKRGKPGRPKGSKNNKD